jgi:hypothetical protein
MAVLPENELFYTEFEPKRKNQFVFFIEGIPTYLIQQANRPEIDFNTITLDHINVKRRLKGKVQEYPDINLTLYDPISPSGSQIVMEWVRLHHEAVTGRDSYADLYKKDVTYNTLDPTGAFVEEWTLKGAFISNVTFGDVSWEDDAEHTIELTLTYDYPVQQY